MFNAALGGTSTFKQLFAVLVHSSAPTVLQQLFVTPLNYVRESMSSATNLAVFLPMLAEQSFPAKLLGMVDFFMIVSPSSLGPGPGDGVHEIRFLPVGPARPQRYIQMLRGGEPLEKRQVELRDQLP